MAESFYTLRASDVGRPIIKAFGRTWLVSSFMGRVLSKDVSKRVYQQGDILQVENDEQREARRTREGT